MRKNRPVSLRLLLACVMLSGIGGCALDAPLPQDYYSGVDKIAGGNPPSVPVLTFTKAQRRFDFTASIDPETGSEVSTYIIYIYTGTPQKYYQPRDIDSIMTSPPQRTFYLNTIPDGTFTVVLTGFDGNRESQINDQNRIGFSWP